MYLYVDVSYLANAVANSLPPDQIRYGAPAIAVEIMAKVAQFVRTYEATRTYFCLDPKEGSWRKQVCPTYKAHREEKLAKDPQRKLAHDLASRAVQVEFPELAALMGCPNFVYPWIEADDFAAAVIANNPGKPGLIITADNDYFQLINSLVYMVDPVHSLRYQLDAEGKVVQYKGDGTCDPLNMTPAECLLAKAIQGDTSDNIPGLIGYGEITAAKVVIEKRVPQILAEETGLVTPRKSKNNPNPVPVQQNARAVVANNLSLMDLFNSRIHQKVKTIAADIEAKGFRNPETNFTRTAVWLEERCQYSREQAERVSNSICTAFRNQWTS